MVAFHRDSVLLRAFRWNCTMLPVGEVAVNRGSLQQFVRNPQAAQKSQSKCRESWRFRQHVGAKSVRAGRPVWCRQTRLLAGGRFPDTLLRATSSGKGLGRCGQPRGQGGGMVLKKAGLVA